mgnify:CR=1 FL=1
MKIAFLTAGGIAPCLSASIGSLINEYRSRDASAEFIGYFHGYKGLLTGNSISFPEESLQNADALLSFGGSPIGNSRVKLTNVDDCIQKGFISVGENPVEAAAGQLVKDGVDILHTIGGDDTNTMAAEIVKAADSVTVVGLPKTVDNDVYPIHQTLGAATAAEQSAVFFENIANENTTSSRHLIIHEVMGRNCGWLTAASAQKYREKLSKRIFLPELLISQDRWDVDAVYIPELEIDFEAEYTRLKNRMNEKDSINIFLSEGAGTETIVSEMEAAGQEVIRDAFGHVALDTIQPGKWFAGQLKDKLDADKVLVQKSGYFARSAAPSEEDLALIEQSASLAAESALAENSGVIGMDEDKDNALRLIEFDRIKGGKPFDTKQGWFQKMLKEIGQII